MKIWFDLTNSPHVNFFASMIRELSESHEVVLTCRNLSNTIELINMNGFRYHVIGKHYGKNKFNKMAGFIIRVWQLYWFLKSKNIDVAISHSSFYSPLVSRIIGCPSIYLNDNEHAAGNLISFMFADRILVPEFVDMVKIIKKSGHPSKLIQYPGVKEGVYLCRQLNYSGVLGLGMKQHLKTIFIRPEPWMAEYYHGKCNFFDTLLTDLVGKFNIVILPRGKQHIQHYRQKKFEGVVVAEKTIRMGDIMNNCDLFIGAGGTMTREAAVLGIPTISTYQQSLLGVDKFLVSKGYMIHRKQLDAAFVICFIDQQEKRIPDEELLKKGNQTYELIKGLLLNEFRNGKNGKILKSVL